MKEFLDFVVFLWLVAISFIGVVALIAVLNGGFGVVAYETKEQCEAELPRSQECKQVWIVSTPEA